MVDIHTHILPNIDDGSRNKDESLMMIKEAYSNGFTSIICTSHYIVDAYNCSKEERQILIDDLQKSLIENNIDVKLYNGAENYISMELDTLIKNNIAPTLNDSKYILFELPMDTKVLYVDEFIEKLKNMNLVPILAHPERYTYMQDNFDMYTKLINQGVLLQGNIASITGKYGSKAKKVIKKLLKANMISFLAADAHRANSIYSNMTVILKKLGKVISKEKIELLTTINPEHILKNEEIIK